MDEQEIPASYRFSQVNCCIYCGSKDVLSDEHVLAYALSGDWILPKASCAKCAQFTGRDEALVLRGGLWAVRNFLGYQSRTKVRRSRFKLHSVNGKEDHSVMVAADHYPVLLSLPTYAGPFLVKLPDCKMQHGPPWYKFLSLDPGLLEAEYGALEYAPSSMHAQAFARMLLKIAHAMTVAAYGLENFEPFLPSYILGQEQNFLLFLGTADDAEKELDNDHIIKIADFDDGLRKWIVAEIHLFARFGAPSYRVIVGQHLGYPRPNFLVRQPHLDTPFYAERVRLLMKFADDTLPGWHKVR